MERSDEDWDCKKEKELKIVKRDVESDGDGDKDDFWRNRIIGDGKG